ncbi:MAG TPA: carboxypeptidase-like regulatory domain-containing protein [Chitinophagaceae bacterium]|nr:carboxypeptidase-like regulatory domain-containing protein [Chitinophagaceae bacterium]
MSEEKNIKKYTAADIENYWRGKLDPAAMHALEKASMDDPFLADALEGYKNTSDVTEDVKVLHNRLEKKVIASTPVLELKEKKFPWLKVAAAVIVICGLGVLVQQLVLKNKTGTPIVNVGTAERDKADIATSKEQQRSDTPQTTNHYLSDTLSFNATEKKSAREKVAAGSFVPLEKDTTGNIDDRLAADIRTESSGIDLAVKSAPAIVSAETKEESSKEKEPLGRAAADNNKSLIEPRASGIAKRRYAEAPFDANTNAAPLLNNSYNYRVVDMQNNPVPFANVQNTRDNVGTYTDIRGNFNLVSSDSVLNVQISSLGYLSDNYKLVPSTQSPTIVLKEDNNTRSQVPAANQRVVRNVVRQDTADLDEPEVGWGHYNTYVANNMQIPDKITKKSTLGNVELSFEIDKTGHPVNIRVTKSSQCKECDEEAIRLLKEGPKWKRKGKKSKTSISIAVDQK